MMDGDRGVLELNVDAKALREVFLDEGLVGDATEFCAPPTGPLGHEDAMETLPCSAGHTACYVSPYGDVYPVRAVSVADGERAQEQVSGYLEEFAGDE